MFFFLIIRRPPRSTRTYTLFPYTTLFRSGFTHGGESGADSPSCLRIECIQRPGEQADGVFEPMPQIEANRRRVMRVTQSLRDGDQANRQIAAVDGCDVAGFESGQRSRLIPVQNLASIAFEAIDRFQRVAPDPPKCSKHTEAKHTG